MVTSPAFRIRIISIFIILGALIFIGNLYLILLPGPGGEIVIDLESDVHWGRAYEDENSNIVKLSK